MQTMYYLRIQHEIITVSRNSNDKQYSLQPTEEEKISRRLTSVARKLIPFRTFELARVTPNSASIQVMSAG